MESYIVEQQGSAGLPVPLGADLQSGVVIAPAVVQWRMRHLDERVFDTSAESHLMRFAKALLGDSGVGQLNKRLLLYRLQSSIDSTHFYALDRFYGAIFGITRRQKELLTQFSNERGGTFDPNFDRVSPEEWKLALGADGAYRSRIIQFARAISHGPTPLGIELVCEAILGFDVDIIEEYPFLTEPKSSWDDIANGFINYGGIESANLTYADLEFGVVEGGPDAIVQRNRFTVVAKRPISGEEERDLRRVLQRIAPANSVYRIAQPSVLQVSYSEVFASDLHADSTYWTVGKYITESAEDKSHPERRMVRTPPFGLHQEEAWSYIAQVDGVASYWSVPGDPEIYRPNYESIVLENGEVKNYLPVGALASPEEIDRGRMASDGIAVAHPYGNLPGTPVYDERTDDGRSIDPTSPVYIDGATAQSVVKSSKKVSWWSQRDTNQYWSTPQRDIDSPVVESIEFDFGQGEDRIVNYFTMELPRFPHWTEVQFWSEESGWVNGFTVRVTDCFPERISLQDGVANPQHDVLGHWQKVSRRIDPVKASKVRIAQGRMGGFQPPTDAFGNSLPYSLGAKNVDVGYRVQSDADIPNGLENQEVWASTQDAFGNRREFFVERFDTDGLSSGSGSPWISAPQPSPNAVVCLYADLQDADGNPQTIDRIWIDPVKAGASINVYYANQIAPGRAGRWISKDEPIGGQFVSSVGSIATTSSGIEIGGGVASGVSVSNEMIHWDLSQDWWVGVHFVLRPTPTVDANGDPIDESEYQEALGKKRILFTATSADAERLNSFDPAPEPEDCYLRLGSKFLVTASYQSGEVVLEYSTQYWREEIRVPLEIGDNRPATIAFGWDSETKKFHLHARTQTERSASALSDDPTFGFSVERQREIKLGVAKSFSIGHPVAPEPSNPCIPQGGANALVLGVVVKQGQKPYVEGEPSRFMATPTTYVAKRLTSSGAPESTDNALFRFLPIFETAQNPWGFLGGFFTDWENMLWEPVARTFVAERGFLYLPTIKAKYLCMEMTGLVPEVHERFNPAPAKMKTLPRRSSEDQQESTYSRTHESVPGLIYSMDENGEDLPDQVLDTYNHQAEALILSDEAVADQVAAADSMWAFKPMHSRKNIAQIFTEVGPHRYVEKSVETNNKIAYFAGLRELHFYRTDYTYETDTAVYQDNLDDLSLFDDVSFDHGDGMLVSREQSGVSATTRSFKSISFVKGLQFATQQSPPVQVIPNHDFSSPVLSGNDWDSLAVDEVTLGIVEGQPIVQRLSFDNVDAETVVVTSIDGSVVYSPVTDYELVYLQDTINDKRSNAVFIYKSLTGESAIADIEEVRVFYQYDNLGWQRVGNPTVTYEPEKSRVKIERDAIPEQFFRSADGSVVQRVVNPVFSFRQGQELFGGSDAGGLISPSVPISRKGTAEAAVRIKMVKDLTAPIEVKIVIPKSVTAPFFFMAQKIEWVAVASATLESGIAGGTYEITANLTTYELLPTIPFYGNNKLPHEPVYPLFPYYENISEQDRPSSQWPLIDVAAGEPPFTAARVSVTQAGATSDSWYIEDVSLFDECILWEFSPNFSEEGGDATWYPVNRSVRNNPQGILRFPKPTQSWAMRATALRAGLRINAWQVRPWYSDRSPVQFLPQFRGSSATLYDQFPPIEDDPLFDGWNQVTPRSWFTKTAGFIEEGQIFGAPNASMANRRLARSAAVAVGASSATASTEASASRSESVSLPEPTVSVETTFTEAEE